LHTVHYLKIYQNAVHEVLIVGCTTVFTRVVFSLLRDYNKLLAFNVICDVWDRNQWTTGALWEWLSFAFLYILRFEVLTAAGMKMTDCLLRRNTV
jgi:hypothetical protein